MFFLNKFFLAFTLIPLTELFILIYMSDIIGIFPTVAIVILTALAGTFLIKKSGGEVMENLKKAMNFQADLSDAILDGALLLVSGVLLITPGFFTDIFGLLIHFPPVKTLVKKMMLKKFKNYMENGIIVETTNFNSFNGFDAYTENQDGFEGKTIEVKKNQDDYYI